MQRGPGRNVATESLQVATATDCLQVDIPVCASSCLMLVALRHGLLLFV